MHTCPYLDLFKPRPHRPQHPPFIVEPHPFASQQALLLRNRDPFPVLGPAPFEPAQRPSRRHHAMARHLWRERVPPQRIAHGSRRRAQVRRQQAVRGHPAARDLAEGCPDAFFEGGALALGDAEELGLHFCWDVDGFAGDG